MKIALGSTISWFIEVLNFLILVRVLLSWVNFNPQNRIIVLLYQLTDPILEPFKRLSARLGLNAGMMDFSPLMALLFLYYVAKPLLLTLIYTFL